MTLSLTNLRILTNNKLGIIDVACPLCGPHARAPFNRKRKVLRIWDDGRFVSFKCVRCEAHGWVRDDKTQQSIPRSVLQSVNKKDRAETAAKLWEVAQERGLHEAYLKSRKCFIPSPNLRSLPANKKHPPAMIARFGSGVITGVHLTHLRPDGRGKADVDTPKITLGPSIGQPIIVHETPKCRYLLIAEGIEDAASLALVTGWSAWAAGSAGRIAAIMPVTRGKEFVMISVDGDAAGKKAFQLAKLARPDIIPIFFNDIDPNKMLMQHGQKSLLKAIQQAARGVP